MSQEKSTEVMRDFIRTITTPELKPVAEAVEISREYIGQRIDELEKASQKMRRAIQEELTALKNRTDDAFDRNESLQHALTGKIDKLSAETVQCIESSQLRLREISEKMTARMNELLISNKEEFLNTIKEYNAVLSERSGTEKLDLVNNINLINSELKARIEGSLSDLSANQNASLATTRTSLHSKLVFTAGILALFQIILTSGLFWLLRHP